LQKPESLYWFECPQEGVKLVCVSWLFTKGYCCGIELQLLQTIFYL
jgi:hypothetical protein